MKIAITGSNGLLGQKLIYLMRNRTDIELYATSKGENRTREKDGYHYVTLDITDEKSVNGVFDKIKPDCIINTAAMTNVDECEKNKEGCRKLNMDAVAYMTKWAEKNKSHIVHISTDFVFDGEKGPYRETDKPNPLSYYAWSKLESENILQQSKASWAILRTIIIYGVVDDAQRSNVVLWTKQSLEQHKKINVITDQFRSPTLAEDLANACEAAAVKRAQGIYHISGKELMSIIDIVFLVADFFKLDKSYINPVTSGELNQPAKRPPKTGFILDKAMKDLDYKPHSLMEGLEIVKQQLEKKS
jgi:dTDP-4-dehydrorhamnose reductase